MKKATEAQIRLLGNKLFFPGLDANKRLKFYAWAKDHLSLADANRAITVCYRWHPDEYLTHEKAKAAIDEARSRIFSLGFV